MHILMKSEMESTSVIKLMIIPDEYAMVPPIIFFSNQTNSFLKDHKLNSIIQRFGDTDNYFNNLFLIPVHLSLRLPLRA